MKRANVEKLIEAVDGLTRDYDVVATPKRGPEARCYVVPEPAFEAVLLATQRCRLEVNAEREGARACTCSVVDGDVARCDYHEATDDLAEAVRLLVIALGKRPPPVERAGPRAWRIEDTRDEQLAIFTASAAMRKAGLPDPLDEVKP